MPRRRSTTEIGCVVHCSVLLQGRSGSYWRSGRSRRSPLEGSSSSGRSSSSFPRCSADWDTSRARMRSSATGRRSSPAEPGPSSVMMRPNDSSRRVSLPSGIMKRTSGRACSRRIRRTLLDRSHSGKSGTGARICPNSCALSVEPHRVREVPQVVAVGLRLPVSPCGRGLAVGDRRFEVADLVRMAGQLQQRIDDGFPVRVGFDVGRVNDLQHAVVGDRFVQCFSVAVEEILLERRHEDVLRAVSAGIGSGESHGLSLCGARLRNNGSASRLGDDGRRRTTSGHFRVNDLAVGPRPEKPGSKTAVPAPLRAPARPIEQAVAIRSPCRPFHPFRPYRQLHLHLRRPSRACRRRPTRW